MRGPPRHPTCLCPSRSSLITARALSTIEELGFKQYSMALTKRLFLIIILQVSVSQAQLPSLRLTVRALRGSCVVIPCTFSNPEQRAGPGELSIQWLLLKKDSSPLEIYSSKSPDLVTPQYRGRTDFVGDLKSGDCSLRINSVRREDAFDYSPWIEPLTETYELYRVTVSDHPEEISLGEPGEMTEGIPVKINCSVVHTCPSSPPTLTWDWKDSNASNYHEDLSNGKWKVVSEMYYKPMAQDHGKSLQCTTTYTETITSKKTITMAIKYAPKGTRVISARIAVIGEYFTLECETESSEPPVTDYAWYKDGILKLNTSAKTLRVAKMSAEDSGEYTCAAHNGVGTGSSSPVTITAVSTDPCWIGFICAFVSLAGNIALLLCIIYPRVNGCKRGKTPAVDPAHSMVDNSARKGSSTKPDECQESVYQSLQHAGGVYDTLKV